MFRSAMSHYRDALDAILSGRLAVSPRGVVYDFTTLPDGAPVRLPVRITREDGPCITAHFPKRRRGWRIAIPVAFLIAAQYLPPRPAGHVLRHLDDNRDNARLSNLAWGTRAQNYADRVRNRTTAAAVTHNG